VRLLQVTIPSGKRETVLSVLDDEGVDYVLTDETSGREFMGVLYAPVPTGAVEPILDKLSEAGVDDQAYTVVLDANTVVSRRYEQLEKRYAEKEDGNSDRIAREELHARAEELAPSTRTYGVMTIISAVIATAGLLLDSPAVVVGSMVIAPLIGPAMAASVGTVVDDQELFERGVKLQIAGMLLAVASAAAFAWFIRVTHLIPPGLDVVSIPEVGERLKPDFLSLAVALGAGVAGALSLASGVSSAIVGVMIAVALIPPAATVGIGIAWGLPVVSLGSGVLALVNILSINLAALLVLWYRGYRPQRWFRLDEARATTLKHIGALAVAIALISVFLGGVTFTSFQNAETESAIREDVNAVVGSERYSSVTLLDTEVSYSDAIIQREPERVIVTVGAPPNATSSGLAARIDTRVDETVGHDIDTRVQYVTVERG